ncbi:MAG: NTP transferase domain-containing protein, partial [Sphingomonas sp.]|nr:NTP transferase domain-containing protein [Sphingomonas sp.]
MSKTTAIVLAGSRPGSDPLAAAFGTDLKALVPVGGKPMVRWPVEALLASDRFSQVRVLAQEPERIGEVLPADPRLVVERSAASIAATLEKLVFDPQIQWPLLVTTADHVLLDQGM